MIEVRPFDGDPADLAAMINASWQGRYLARDLIPVYDGPGLAYQVLGAPNRSLHLAAYDGARLVGCFLAEPVTLRVAGEVWRGSQGSYFSVRPEDSSRGVATRLIARLQREHRDQGLAFMLGYVNSSPTAPAYQFWTRFRQSFPQWYAGLRDVHFWMRFLRPRDMARQMDHPAEALGLRVLSALQGPPGARGRGTPRALRDTDGAAAHLLLDRSAARAALAQLWETPGAVRRELHAPAAHTLVMPSGGGVAGLSKAFRWPLRGLGEIPAEAVDLLLLDDLGAAQRRSLLRATAHGSAARGAWVCVAPRLDWAHADSFLACGFVPVPKVCTLMMLFPDPTLDLHAVRASTRAGPLRFR